MQENRQDRHHPLDFLLLHNQSKPLFLDSKYKFSAFACFKLEIQNLNIIVCLVLIGGLLGLGFKFTVVLQGGLFESFCTVAWYLIKEKKIKQQN